MVATSHSLLQQLQAQPDGLAWQHWHDIYQPLIHGWLQRHRLLPSDRDDLTQEVLTVVVRRLPEFHHNGRVGAFRRWLKTITIHCLQGYWKEQRAHPHQAAALSTLDDWADPVGSLSQAWDRDHDQHVVQKLLAFVRPEFTPETWAAFEGVVLQGRSPAEVAEQLRLSANAVYIAKSRVLTRLRQEGAGLLDEAFGP